MDWPNLNEEKQRTKIHSPRLHVFIWALMGVCCTLFGIIVLVATTYGMTAPPLWTPVVAWLCLSLAGSAVIELIEWAVRG